MNILRDFFTFLLFYCLAISTSGCATASKLAPNNDDLLLEMITDASDSVYPPGKSLDLRVYESGKTEFDNYSPDELHKVEPATPQLKQTTINSEQLSAIRAVLNKLNSGNPKSTYPPTERIFDARIVTTITYKSNEGMKTIILQENDSHLHLEKKKHIYPQPLIELLNLSYKIGASVRKATVDG